jgi:hypothetical protein
MGRKVSRFMLAATMVASLLGVHVGGGGVAHADADASGAVTKLSTNNVTDYRLDANVVQPGSWSYLYVPATGTPAPLSKGTGTKFATDEWAQDVNNANHVWFVKANGQIGTDYKQIAFNYTASADQAGKTVRLHGQYTAVGSGHFKILLSRDADPSTVSGTYDTLLDYTGASTSFDLNVTLQAGNDILFVSSNHQYWWEPAKLDATVDTLQAQPVTANPPAGTVDKNTQVALATSTVGASVYYTLDSSDPLSSATRLAYTGPITVTADTYLTAVATRSDLLPSEPATFAYQVNTPAGDGGVNPSTNNVTDYNLNANVVQASGWSYLNVPATGAPALLKKGTGTKFATDEWALDVNNSNHVWFVKADGEVGTDGKPIAFNYTVGDDQAGKTLRLQGTFTANGSGHFRILQTADTDAGTVSGPYTTLFEYTGATTSFKVETAVQKGNDILFVTDNPTYWWEPSKVNATVVTENVPQAKGVVSTPDPGSIPAGEPTSVTLTSATEGATITYTTDGSDPLSSASKMEYAGPFAISDDTVVKAVAAKDGMEPSDVATFNFVVKTPFRNFNGLNQGPDQDLVGKMAWNRFDFSWGRIEPAKGQINQDALNDLKRRVLTAKSNGITILPVLDYSAGWAANRTGYTYQYNGLTYEVGPVISEHDDKLTRQVVTKDANGQIVSTETKDFRMGNTPPENVEDWKNYVKLIVSTFSAAPYNLDYFQVWNEAYPTSGFWYGGVDQFMDLIHLPAASIIHDYGKKVVYGGWICGAPIDEFIDLLDRKHAWNSADVYDVHYMPLEAMDKLYEAAVKRGIPHPAVWQTELGFSLNDKFVADTYPRAFYWALERQATNQPDQFKLFYFANWAPNDPAAYGYNRSLHSGNSLSTKGKTLDELFNLLGGDKVKTYDDFSTSPSLKPEINENLSSAEGFKVDDKRIVMAVHMKNQGDADIFVDWNGGGDTMHLGANSSVLKASLRGVTKDWTVKRVDLFGNETPLQWSGSGDKHGLQVNVPVKDTNPDVAAINATGNETIFYIVAEAPDHEVEPPVTRKPHGQ